jgi:hypothetical protein
MAADDFLNLTPDQGLPAGLDTTAQSGNRPASGARHATPGEVLSQSFQGAQNAGDFLGLDTEFTASFDPDQGGGPLDLAAPPSTAPADDMGYVPEPAPLPASDPVQDFSQAPSAFEFGEDLGSELGDSNAPEREGKGRLLVGGLLVAGLAAAGVFFGPDLVERFRGQTTEVASTSGPGRKPNVASQPAPAKPTQASKPEDRASAVVPAPVESQASERPDDPPALATSGEAKPAPKARPGSEDQASAGEAEEGRPLDLVAARPTLSGPTPRTSDFPNLDGQDYEWASEDQLELIWRGSEVPMEAVHAPAKTLMPRVGPVRVFTAGGDVFAGRLYAVGQGLVWIDGEPGRIGLDGSKVERIEVLPPDPTGTPVAQADELLGGRRVRVKVPGGMLYGSVLKAEGEDVMLALDTGGRVRVKATDIQDLGSGRAVVMRQ